MTVNIQQLHPSGLQALGDHFKNPSRQKVTEARVGIAQGTEPDRIESQGLGRLDSTSRRRFGSLKEKRRPAKHLTRPHCEDGHATAPWYRDLDGDAACLDDVQNRITIALAEHGRAGIPGERAGDLRDSMLLVRFQALRESKVVERRSRGNMSLRH